MVNPYFHEWPARFPITFWFGGLCQKQPINADPRFPTKPCTVGRKSILSSPLVRGFEFVAEWFKFSCNKFISELQLELRVCHWCNKLRGPCQVVRRMRTVHSFYYGATGSELLAVDMLSVSTAKSWGNDFSESIYKKKSFSLLCYINIFLRGNNTDDQTTALYVKGQTMKKNLLIKNSYLK